MAPKTAMRGRSGPPGWRLGRSKNDGHRNLCALLFQQGLPVVEEFTSPRAWAFVMLAMQEYLRTFSGDRNGEPVARSAHPSAAGPFSRQCLEGLAMVRAGGHLRQRQAFPCDDPERLLDFARRRARSRAADRCAGWWNRRRPTPDILRRSAATASGRAAGAGAF